MKNNEKENEIPCPKCLYDNPLKADPFYCDPTTCEKLTAWLTEEAKRIGNPSTPSK